MNLQPIFIREEVIKSIREFFYARKFHEVVTPTLNSAIPIEPNIYPFVTLWKTIHGEKKYYLSTSPESGLKKMIGEGLGNCFAIAKSFRNLEDSGTTHIPEFLMLEWYRKDATYKDIMNDMEELVLFVIQKIGVTIKLGKKWKRHTMIHLFKKYADVNLQDILDDQKMKTYAKKKGYQIHDATWEQLFNQIFLNEIESELGVDPCFVVDFPSRISPLCKPKKDFPQFAERFEVYLKGIELGNGNTENTNTESIKRIFNREKKEREKKQMVTPPIDTTFLTALKNMQQNSYAGIGIGVDRLAMILAGAKTIEEVDPILTDSFTRRTAKNYNRS